MVVMIMMKWMITIAVITHMAWAEGYQYIFFEKKNGLFSLFPFDHEKLPFGIPHVFRKMPLFIPI